MSYDPRICLTISQPWATWVALGLKPFENRTWQTPYRGELWIHAGKKFDASAFRFVEARMSPDVLARIKEIRDYPRGAIIGRAKLVEIVTETEDPWFVGPFGLRLENAVLVQPEPMRGFLGLWTAGDARPPKPTPEMLEGLQAGGCCDAPACEDDP